MDTSISRWLKTEFSGKSMNTPPMVSTASSFPSSTRVFPTASPPIFLATVLDTMAYSGADSTFLGSPCSTSTESMSKKHESAAAYVALSFLLDPVNVNVAPSPDSVNSVNRVAVWISGQMSLRYTGTPPGVVVLDCIFGSVWSRYDSVMIYILSLSRQKPS